MAEGERLPTDATLFVSAADEIIDDGAKTQATYKYWSERFAAENEPCLDGLKDAKTPAATFARNLPDQTIAKLLTDRPPVLIVDRSSLFGGDRDLLLELAGCLMSGAEISKTCGGDGTIDSLDSDFANLKRLNDQAAKGKADGGTADSGSGQSGGGASSEAIDEAAAVRGLMAARELLDVVRRYKIANDHSTRWGLTLAECIALHRQEGAFAITPDKTSFTHGPLIQTGTPCRPAGVQHTLNGKIADAIVRPGFSLVLPRDQYLKELKVIGKETEASDRFEMIVTNMLVTGGLDNIVAWVPENSAADELVQLVRAAFTDAKVNGDFIIAFNADLKDLSPQQIVRAVLFVTLNLVSAQVEVSTTQLSATTAISAAFASFSSLARSHAIEQIKREDRTDVHLIGDDHSGDTESVLRVQTMWYRSRKRLLTLMPIRDRVPGLKDLQFTPLVSYLRFHTGDAMFMGIILRLLRLLDDLIKAARDKGVKANPPWGAQFLSAIKATKWAKRSSAEKKQIRGDLDHWHKHVNMEKATEDHPNQETMWRDVGLIDSFLKGPAPPSWLKPFVPPDKKISKKAEIESFQLLKHTADVATRTVNLILKYELLESLGLALETIPVTTLIDAGALPLPQRKASDIPAKFFPQLAADDRLKKFRQVAARAPLVKAHNFERLRLVFDGAVQGKFK